MERLTDNLECCTKIHKSFVCKVCDGDDLWSINDSSSTHGPLFWINGLQHDLIFRSRIVAEVSENGGIPKASLRT